MKMITILSEFRCTSVTKYFNPCRFMNIFLKESETLQVFA
jgi:hypothetical protein